MTLAERRSGGVWTVQSTPNPAKAAASALNGVSCPSGSACTGVGQFVAGSGAQLTLAERWNGRDWRIQPTPNPAGSSSSSLFAVACPAPDSCTAVGASDSKVLVERWDGARWRIQSAPVPPGAQFSELNAVSCTAAASCVAVGDYVNSSGADVTLAERWNGTSWAIQPTPNPSGTQFFSVLTGVSCTARDACEASGGSDAGAFAERWNGVQWRIQPTPPLPGIHDLSNFSVACPAPSACIAAGGFENDGPGAKTLTEQWRGSGTSTTRTAPTAFSSRAYLGMAGCIRAALGEGGAIGAAATRIGPRIKAPMPPRSQPASENGRVINLGTLPGGYESQANDINDLGQVSGFASNGISDPYSFFGWGTRARSFIWHNGVMRDIGSLGGPDAVSTTLNAAGQITGQSYTSTAANPATGIPTLDPFL